MDAFVDNGVVRINYQALGGGRPLVLLHGYSLDSQAWQDMGYVEPLIKAGFRPVLVDIRGHGARASRMIREPTRRRRRPATWPRLWCAVGRGSELSRLTQVKAAAGEQKYLSYPATAVGSHRGIDDADVDPVPIMWRVPCSPNSTSVSLSASPTLLITEMVGPIVLPVFFSLKTRIGQPISLRR
jgi:hypothetical protein